MVKLENLIGDILYISFYDPQKLNHIGITENGHYCLKGFDQLGIWLEHPGITLQTYEDSDGIPIPHENQKKEFVKADFMVRWENINSIMQYPDRLGFDFNNDKAKIGFELIKNKTGDIDE